MSASDDAMLAIRLITEAKELSYDTETSGLDWKVNFPIGYSFSDGTASVYVPVRHGGGGNLPDVNVRPPVLATDAYVVHDFEKVMTRAFATRRGITIGHHIKFDCHMSANVGVMLGRNLACTQVREALLDEYAKHYSLEASAARRGVQAKKSDQIYAHIAAKFGISATKDAMSRYWELPGDDPIASEYAIGDTVSTIQLFLAQQTLIDQQELNVVDELERELIWTLFRMERRGVKVDVKYLQDTLVAIEDRVKGCYASLPSGFNVRSPKCVKDYVEAAGHTDWPLTEKNNPSFDENWLKGFPEGQKIVEIRKWTNLANTFAKPLVNEHVHKGRVHANFNQLKGDDGGTIARLSCSHPNLQAVPKRDKELAKLFRKGFVADDGMTFFEDDYSQCEPRLFASYSADVNLVNGYNQTPFKDAHSVVAELLNVERDPTAKRMNMGIFTGMYPKAFAGHMNWSIVQATEAWNKWFELFPGIRGFQDKAKEVLVYRGYVKTLLGRRGRLENPRFAYRATSKIIQGSNADILKYFMVKLDKMLEADGDHTHLLMTIHDAFQGQFPDGDEGKQYHEMMREIMVKVQEPPFNLRVPFVVDSGYGKTWCDATFGGKK